MFVHKVPRHNSSNKLVQTVGSQMMRTVRITESAHLKYDAAAKVVVRRND